MKDFFTQITVAIITVLFGGIIATGIVETYKNDLTFKREVVENYFSPFVAKHSNCSLENRNYLDALAQYGGSFQILFSELKNISLKADIGRMGGDEALWSQSVLQSFVESQKNLQHLKNTVSTCRNQLYVESEKLAILLGAYPQFKKEFSNYSNKMNSALAELEQIQNEAKEGSDPDELIKLLKEGLSNADKDIKFRKEFISELEPLAKKAKALNMSLLKHEIEIFNADQNLYSYLHELFANKVSDMQTKQFFGWLWN